MSRIGIDLGGTKIEIIVLGQNKDTLLRRRVATPSGDYAATLHAIADLVKNAEREIKLPRLPIGVSMPGAISRASGLVKNSNSTCLIGKPFQKDLEGLLERPVRLENDANCFVLSESIDGAASEARLVFGVILGTGVGGGIVVDRKVVVGPNAITGEWGHNSLPWMSGGEHPGPDCYCGKNGCIETFLSGPALARDFKNKSGREAFPENLEVLTRDGDRDAECVLEIYEDRLARALSGVINILDPEVIVLGGGVSNLERLYANVPKLWAKYVFSDRVDTVLRKAKYGDSSGVRGAAWLWPES
ncbi:MAG: ROK family protein [Bdellovibrionota bacterium]